MTLGRVKSVQPEKWSRTMWCPMKEDSRPVPPCTESPAIVDVLHHPGVIARNAARWRAQIVSSIAIFVELHAALGTDWSWNRPVTARFISARCAVTKSIADVCGEVPAVCSYLHSSGSRSDGAMEKLPQLLQDLLYAEEYHLLDNDAGQAAKQAFEAGVTDTLVRSLISGPVARHKIAQAFAGPFPLPKLVHGDLEVGFDINGRPLRTFRRFANGHFLTVAGTGSGKTTRDRFVVLQIAPHVKSTWLFDLRKQEFTTLRPPLQRLGVDLRILRARSLRLNPIQVPKHVHPADFAPRVADMLVQVLFLPPRASKLLHATILRLYQSFDVFAGSRRYPTLFDLREAVAADKGANPPARQAIVDSLDPVLMSLGPEVLGYHMGWSTHDLAQRHIAFELGGAAEVDKDLILNGLILSEFASRVAQGISNPSMDLYIVCDEAARLVSPSSGGLGVSDLIGLVRGTGIGLDLSVQTSDVAPAILSNTANKVIGRCGSATDYEVMGNAIGLTVDQRRWMTTHLVPGLFVGQLGEGDWRFPFVFRVPRWNPANPVGFPATAIHLGDLEHLPVVRAAIPQTSVFGNSSLPIASPPSASANSTLSAMELRYLEAVVRHPGKPSSAYTHLAGIGAKQAQQIRKHLVAESYLREHCINMGSRGRASIVLEPLAPTHQVLGQAGNGRGGNQP